MSERKIIHIDMDAFYASVEQRDNPELRGRPIAVGHPGERGVVSAASYEARKYGVRSAMSSLKALRMCPELVFVPGRMEVYKEVSDQIHKIFHDYTDIIEPLALDEAFLAITSQLYDDGIELSGGEKQRLALARIYLWKRAVTILDEPTSSLDPFVENSFYEKMLSDYPGTLIIISHRITFSYRMSRIISLEDGTIKEIGTPTELLQKPDSLYKEMYDLNTKKYINKN